jgi:hypothetical protein
MQNLASKVIDRSLLVLVNGESALATSMAAMPLVMLFLAAPPASTSAMHFGKSALATTIGRDPARHDVTVSGAGVGGRHTLRRGGSAGVSGRHALR